MLRSYDDVLRALDALEKEPRERLGWALAHCAQSIEYAVTGFPRPKPWLFQRTIGRIALGKFLRQGRLSHDRTAAIPGAEAIPADLGLDRGIARLRSAIATFRAAKDPLAPHFAYGPVARDAYETVQSMHVADHLE